MKNIIFLILSLFGLLLNAQPPTEGGVEFNGIDEYILVPDSDNINERIVENRTIETYFKVDDATNLQTFYKEGGNVNSIKFMVEDGYLLVGCYRDSGGTGKLIYFRKAIQNNTWYHVALVLDNASTLRFYLDGVLQDSRPNFFAIPRHPGDFELGRTSTNTRYPDCDTWTPAGTSEYCLDNISDNDATIRYFGGHMWGFRIWDVARTGAEIDNNKDILITDTTTAPGDDIIAYLDGESLTYLDSDGDFEEEDVQVVTLNTNQTVNFSPKLNIIDNSIVISNLNRAPESLMLFNLQGKLISQTLKSNRLAIPEISDGIYILRTIYQDRITNNKLLIRK